MVAVLVAVPSIRQSVLRAAGWALVSNEPVAPADIIGIGLGAYEACRPWAAGQDTGFKGALFISGLDVGAAAAEVLYNNVVNGAEIPPTTVAKTTIVGPDNYKDVMDATSVANCGG